MPDQLGDYIRNQRELHPTYRSLRHFAAALGKSPSWLSKVERNEEMPGDDTLIKIASLLGADSRKLFELARRLEPDIHKAFADRYGEFSGLLRTIKDLPPEKVIEVEATVNTINDALENKDLIE